MHDAESTERMAAGSGRAAWRSSGAAWVVLLCALGLTVGAWRYAAAQVRERARVIFNRRVERVPEGLRRRMDAYETVLRAGAALFEASVEVTRAEWKRFVAEIGVATRYPGMTSLVALERVPSDTLVRHVDAVHAEGLPDYQVHPVGARSEYFPVVFAEPEAPNRTALGYDLLSEPHRRAAAERARDTGLPAVTENLQLLQDAGGAPRPAFLMFYPVYRDLPADPTIDDRRRSLAGFVAGTLRMDDLMTALQSRRRRSVAFAIYDGTEAQGAPLYGDASPSMTTGTPEFQRDIVFPIGGHAWTIRFAGRPWLDPSFDGGEPMRVLLGGLIVSGLLFSVVRTQGVTERRAIARATEMTSALRDREARLRAIVDTEPECVKVVSPDGRLLEMNAAGLAMVEATEPGEVLGKAVLDLVHPDDRDAFQALHDRVVGGDSGALAFRIVGLRGGGRWMETSSVPLRDARGTITSVLSVTRDITERKRAEDDRRASEERYRQIVETATEGVWIIDADDRTVLANRRMAELLGYEPAEMIGRRPFDFMDEAGRQLATVKLARRRAGITEKYDVRLLRKDGRTLWALLSARPEYDAAGRYKGALAMVTDITARKRAEEAYQRAQSLISSIVEHSPAVIFVKDAENLRYVLFNKACEELVGTRREEMIGKSDYDLFPKDEADAFTAKDREVLASGRRADVDDELIQTRTGLRHLRTAKVPITDETGRPRYLLGISEDITDRRQLEDQLRQAQKMEAIGTLAGGLAHDFNNILACIVGFGELARMDCASNPPALENLANVLEAGLRGKGLVEQLLAFSRQQEPARQPVEPGAAVASALTLVRPTLSPSVTIHADIAPELPLVLADAMQLHRVVANLVTNGAQAMAPQGGRLDVELGPTTVDDQLAARHLELSPGDYVRLVVRDRGAGMDAATLERIYEPFFTTKELGQGVGLGLAVVHGIVKSHGGAILVTSTPGHGTTFEVYLPVHECSAAPAPEPKAAAIPRGRGERILFVDDEVRLAELGRRMLESLGYQVTALTNPVDAALVFRTQPDLFDLVVTDLMMPLLSGTELAEEVLRIRPDTPILLSTGFERRVPSETARRLGLRGVVAKPSTVETLAWAVHGALSGTA
jgi:PAS domain S-box-containing protein